MTLNTLDHETGPQPRRCLIILHGLGADGSDFEPVCQALARDLADLGPLRFVLPSAPVMPVSMNGGYRMRAWYDIRPHNHPEREDPVSMRASLQAIHTLIDQQVARGIPAEGIVLMGFSQGCAMTLLAGLRYPQRLAGLVALSGYLPLADTTQAERHAANARTPVFMGHGDADGVVPMQRGQQAYAVLSRLGQPVQWHDYPIDHSVSLDEIADIRDWLRGVWSGA
ncbi:MAG TPA: alpha/beta fold hydrolase [Aquabacterium sp.]|uniref:alpha/beta hydrolase n=1 Tax=Aquabacterium sp. TaxID=1872578 RepID=UPI002E37BB55|nr:alpha/beta fold hydrolase [Aquabacterium sp.]HEX5374192.1 alpha/beta fold hydrolase [Aquabacterium sp.]